MTEVAGGGNYVSDSSLMAWVTVQQSREYGRLQEAMDFETLRGDMMTDLAKIKADAQKATTTTKGIVELNKEIEAFVEKYGQVPEFKGIVDLVAGLGETVGPQAEAAVNYKALKAAYDEKPVPGVDEDDTRGNPPTDATTLSADQVKDWKADVDAASDATNQNEQLGMIHINELKSTIDHSTDLTSQLIKSSNDSTKFTINNFT